MSGVDPAVAGLLRDTLADPGTGWSLGSFGAVAEFVRTDDEPLIAPADGRLGGATARGAIALGPTAGLRPIAYETGFSGSWSHAVALCLPENACAMGRRRVLTELGPDAEAVRPEDRGAILFDLGLGLSAIDACLRTDDPDLLAILRAGLGRPVLNADGPIRHRAGSAHRVFRARIGRIEVFGASPPRAGGPRALIVPEMLKAGRTHAATSPIPEGWVPCGALHPPHPCKDGLGRPIPFEPARHAAFQALLAAWGDPALRAARHGPGAGSPLPPGLSPRHARSARRAAEAQAPYLAGARGAPEPYRSE